MEKYIYCLSLRVVILFEGNKLAHFLVIDLLVITLFNDTQKENCVLLNSVQEFIEIEAWLLLTFFIGLHN